MTEPITPAATPTPAPASATPAAPAAAEPAKPAASATPEPAKPATPATPATTPAPAKTLLEQAGEPAAAAAPAPSTEDLHEAAYSAIEAYKTNEDPAKDETLAKAMNDAIAAARKASADAKAAPKKAESAAPEKYDMKLPEGQALDETLLSDVTPILREANLSNDQLNKLAPIATKIQEKAIAAYVAMKTQEETDRDAAETKTSKEALGAKWQEQLGLVAKARDRFFSPESKAILTKHGNNIHLIQDLIKLGGAISEGKLVDGKPAGAGTKTTGEVLYPSMAQT